MKKILFFFIFISYSFFSYANDNQQKQVDDLFDQLKTSTNYEDSKKIESKIWELWTTHPSESLTALLADGSFYMSQNQLETAYETFTKAIELDSYWAEAWNKRATVYYMIGEFEKSQNDINKVLNLEERHFGALAGQGLVNIQLKNYEKAILSYQMAEKIYPTMRSPKIMIKQIQELIKRDSI